MSALKENFVRYNYYYYYYYLESLFLLSITFYCPNIQNKHNVSPNRFILMAIAVIFYATQILTLL